MKWCRTGAVGFALASLLMAATLALGVPSALGVTSWATTQITFGSPDRQELQISGDRAVWLAMDGTYTQVFTLKLGVDTSATQLTTDANNHENPQVSGDRVVWQGSDGAHYQIFTQKVGVDAASTQLTTDASDHSWPAVSGDRVVWTGADGPSRQVFTLKVGVDASATQLTTDAHNHSGLAVDGDRVVWEALDDAYRTQVFTQKIGVEAVPLQLTSDSRDHMNVQVSGDRLVWQAPDPAIPSGYQIFTQKIGVDSSPVEVTTDANDHERPRVSGDRIVWQGWADYRPQIYTMKIGVDTSPIEISTDREHYHHEPAVSGDRVVWSAQTTAVPEPIYQVFTRDMDSDASPVQITHASSQQQYPLVSGDRVVWYSYDGFRNQISTASPACRLCYLAGAHGALEGSATQLVAFDGSGTSVRAVPEIGYRFAEWSDDSAANPRTDAEVTADATFTASFAINPVYSTSLKLSGAASVKVKKSYKVAGTIKPSAAVGRVKILWKRYYSRSYHTVKTVYATITSGKYSSSYTPTKRGKWRAYVSYAKQYAAAASYKAAKTVYKSFSVK